MPLCRSCNAEVVFVRSATTGKNVILDAKPVKGIVLASQTGQLDSSAEDPRFARVVDIYTDHHATCPHAEAWRDRSKLRGHS